MNQSTKQRVVGSVVLLALALIFLPIIFDGEGSYQRQLTSRIPNPPEIEPLPEPVQTRPRIIADSDEINLTQEQLQSNRPEAESDAITAAAGEVEESNQIDATSTAAIEPDSDDAAASVNEQSFEDLIQSLASTSESDDEIAVVTSQPAFSRLETPELDQRGLPQSWSVRLGSFSDAENARKLVNELLDADYKAYTRTMRREQGDLTAVFVGPWVDRLRVDEYKQKLEDEFQLNGMVVRFEIDRL